MKLIINHTSRKTSVFCDAVAKCSAAVPTAVAILFPNMLLSACLSVTLVSLTRTTVSQTIVINRHIQLPQENSQMIRSVARFLCDG